MITIVMPYYNRQKQTIKTLESFMQYDPKDFNVIIADDCSQEDFVRPDYPFEVTVLKLREKKWFGPEPVLNIGMHTALLKNPEIVIMQNAECFHAGDILGYAKRVTDETYITFGCYASGEGEELNPSIINNRCVTMDGKPGWYNHPVYRPVALEFCAAITANNMRKLNGYDERFGLGLCYADSNLIYRIRKLGLKVEITADPFVFHQWHYREPPSDAKTALAIQNSLLYAELEKEPGCRAKHIFTPDFE